MPDGFFYQKEANRYLRGREQASATLLELWTIAFPSACPERKAPLSLSLPAGTVWMQTSLVVFYYITILYKMRVQTAKLLINKYPYRLSICLSIALFHM